MINVDIVKRFITDSEEKHDLSNLEYIKYMPFPNDGDIIICCSFLSKDNKIIDFSFFFKYYKSFEKKYYRIQKLESI